MTRGIFSTLADAADARGTLLCIGLDPRIDASHGNPTEAIVEANRRVIGETAPYALAYKPNIAFYERFGGRGLDALVRTLEMIPKEICTILDAKRGDIGSTAEQYAAAAFETFGVDFVTVSPYLGRDSLAPFLAYEDRGVFVLCRTSNPSAAEVQDIEVPHRGEPESGGTAAGPSSTDRAGRGTSEPLYLALARRIERWGDGVGLVVAGNDASALGTIRGFLPHTWFLAPGIGAQGGDVGEAIGAGADAEGRGILPVVARAIAGDPNPAAAARRFRDAIQEARSRTAGRGADWRPAGTRAVRDEDLRDSVVRGLFSLGCFELGEFTLKSGRKSPFYVDLRRAVAYPSFMRTLARAYARLSEGLQFDRIAAIPVAALPPATALSLTIDRPMIYPRIPPKPHGSGRRIEGAYREGERVLLVDDLITTGGSKAEAIEVLESEGLRVEHLVVLLERGRQGRRDMERLGVELRSYLTIEELLSRGRELGLVSAADEKRILDYVASDDAAAG